MTPNYGDPDGHGRYGILDTDQDGNLVCHECGGTYKHLGTHVRQRHGIMPDDYRAAHGLGHRTRLISDSVAQRLSDLWHEDADARKALLAQVRDPQRAQRASRGRPWRIEAAVSRSEAAAARAVTLTPEQIEELGDWYDIPGWVARFRALQKRDGIPAQAAARALGVSQSTIAGRLRRYPEPVDNSPDPE